MTLYPNWWRKEFLLVELICCVVIGSTLFLWAKFCGGINVLTSIVEHNRGQIYGTLSSIFGSLLGFAITAMSIVLGFSASDRLTVLRESDHYTTLWKVFTSTIRWLALTTVIWLLALFFERETKPRPYLLVFALAVTSVAVFRLARTLWALEKIVSILTVKKV